MRNTLVSFSLVVIATVGCGEDSSTTGGNTNREVVADSAILPDGAFIQTDSGVEADMRPEVDSAVEAVVTACDEGEFIDFNSIAVSGENGALTVEGTYRASNDLKGSCGGLGNEQVFQFTAPAGGLWTFRVESDDAMLDTVMYARTNCFNAETEIQCNDDRVEGQTLLSGFEFEMTADEQIFIIVDAYGGVGAPFRLRAQTLPVVEADMQCDPAEETNICAADYFCDNSGSADGESGICVSDLPPSIEDVLAYRAGDVLSIQINGSDTAGDVVTGRLQLYQGANRIILDPEQGSDTFIMDPIDSVEGQEQFVYRYRASVFENWPETTSIRVALSDRQGNSSNWTEANIRNAIAVQNECDEHRIVNFCGEGTACLDPDENGTFTCSPITAPSVRSAKGYYDASTRLIGFEVGGIDPDRDVERVFVELLDANGDGIASGELPFDRVNVTDERFNAVLSFQLADDFPFTQARVIAIDAEGLRSEPRNIASMRLPRDVNEGDACDPVGARTRCVGDVYCFAPDADTQPVCGIPPTTCPGDWPEARVIEGNPVAELWRFEGDLTRARNYTSGSCGGGAGQVLYSFTAANSGTYSFLVNPIGAGDPIAYIRTHCRFGAQFTDFEIACSDNHGGFTRSALVRADVEAGETVYLFVDGAPTQSGPWRGPFELIVRQLP